MIMLTRLGTTSIEYGDSPHLSLQRGEASFRRSLQYAPAQPSVQSRLAFVRAVQRGMAGTEVLPMVSDDIADDGQDIVAMFIRFGDHALAAKRVGSAFAWYQQAADSFPDKGTPWHRLGRIARINGEPEREIEAYQQASELDADNRDIWYDLGIVYEEESAWDKALAAYQQGLQGLSGRVGKSNLYYRIGLIYQREFIDSRWDEAWIAYEQALAATDFSPGPENIVNTLRRRGELLIAQKRWDEAEIEFRRALVFDAENYWGHLSLAQSLWALGRVKEAIETLQTAIEIVPDNANAYRYLGDYYRLEGDIERARAAYLRLLELNPDSEPTQRKLEALDSR